jgi:PAS domain-containing protein
MTFFWHGHFACKPDFGKLSMQYLNTLRKHALGKFGDMLLAIAQDPAMIRYLNNQQNRKEKPNENFARELMELFTLGRGQYSEKDIKEAARAFTGWSSDLRGDYLFRPMWHDYGSKTFFGKTGTFDGKDIVNIILEKPETAQFIVRLTSPAMPGVALPDPRLRFIDVLERMPDAFVVTSDDFIISACNAAFLDLVQLAGPEQARGQPLARYLGRPGVDVSLLMAQLREHGVVRGFATVLRTSLDTEEEAEVSAVTVQDGAPPAIGFAIRPVGRRMRDRSELGRSLPRSVEQLTELVGRVSLKEIVRETTDLIERLCIEAALNITGDNRASAAEVLGLSRQSLYSKLHRYGLGNLAVDQD